MRPDVLPFGGCVNNLGKHDNTRRCGGRDHQWRPNAPLEQNSYCIRNADTAWLLQPKIRRSRRQIYLPTNVVGAWDIVELRYDDGNRTLTPINVAAAAPGGRQCDTVTSELHLAGLAGRRLAG